MNKQEKNWSLKFGVTYTKRNKNIKKPYLIKLIFKKIKSINSVFEFGTNIGNNLDIIKKINRKILTYGVEINKYACQKAQKKGHNVVNTSIFKLKNPLQKYDLTFTYGVLIHINPRNLKQIYEKLFKFSKKYILIIEYISEQPGKVIYRRKKDLLFSRDFAKEIKNKYKLKIIDYGFMWSEDKKNTIGNHHWFLFKK